MEAWIRPNPNSGPAGAFRWEWNITETGPFGHIAAGGSENSEVAAQAAAEHALEILGSENQGWTRHVC